MNNNYCYILEAALENEINGWTKEDFQGATFAFAWSAGTCAWS